MQDHHSGADEALYTLREYAGNPCYQAMVNWIEAMYEREKERIALCDNTEVAMTYWFNCKGLRELRFDIDTETD